MKQSILLPEHEAAGARLTEGPAGPVLLTGGDVPAEYRAAREGCVLLDETDRGLVRATGGEAVEFLHRLLANDVRSLAPGSGNANLLLSSKGKVLHGFDLFRRDDEIVLSTEPGGAPALAEALEMYHFTEDVALEDATDEHAPIALTGSLADEATARIVASVLGEVPALASHAHVTREWNGHRVWITALRVAGVPALRLDAGPEGAVTLWRALRDAGAVPVGIVARDILRCEAGAAAFGVDVTADVYPQEARLDDAFSLEKGCYIGQEVVAKIDTYGGLNKLLLPLSVSHDDPVPAGTELLDPDESDGDRRALGLVTSWAYSFALDGGLVLAYVKRKHQEPGTVFRLAGDAHPDATATIVAAPLTVPWAAV